MFRDLPFLPAYRRRNRSKMTPYPEAKTVACRCVCVSSPLIAFISLITPRGHALLLGNVKSTLFVRGKRNPSETILSDDDVADDGVCVCFSDVAQVINHEKVASIPRGRGRIHVDVTASLRVLLTRAQYAPGTYITGRLAEPCVCKLTFLQPNLSSPTK